MLIVFVDLLLNGEERVFKLFTDTVRLDDHALKSCRCMYMRELFSCKYHPGHSLYNLFTKVGVTLRELRLNLGKVSTKFSHT